VNVLGQKELNLLVGELAQLRAEDIMYADVICISSVVKWISAGSSTERATVAMQHQRLAEDTHER
jgi:hypothetical protein